MSDFIAKRVKAGVPIWNLLVNGVDIGAYTEFSGGPMATVSLNGLQGAKTVTGSNRAQCLANAKAAYYDLLSLRDDERYCDEVALETAARIRQAVIDSEDYAWRYEYY